MYKNFLRRVGFFLFSFLTILCLCPTVYAQSEEEMKVLQMFYKEDELVVTPTRQPKSVSQVAENITVITYKDIEQMNAHTLTDVLNTIPGVQVNIRGGPGIAASAIIQGSEFKHVLVMIDGVTINNLSNNFADVSAIPVQHIERIEIIKGPASSSWGSSLGGIINIITKSPEGSRKIGGTLSASYGERNTGDYRAEMSGTVGKVGYYIYGGNILSDGFRPNTNFYENNVYTKLKWEPTDSLSLLFTFGYNKGNRGDGQDVSSGLSFKNNLEYLFSTLSLNYLITAEADFNLSLRTSRQNTEAFTDQLSTGDELGITTIYEKRDGASAKLIWRYGVHSIVFGGDFDSGELKSNNIKDEKQELRTWSLFANDTIVINKFSFTPGIRYDHTNTNGDFVSPSFGITYKLDEKTLLRGYVARGFSIPPLFLTFGTVPELFFLSNPDLKMEKVWSYQVGIESIALNYLWLKSSLFMHDLSDAIVTEQFPEGFKAVNKGKQRRQGFEVEAKTIPFYNTSLFAGFVFIDAKDRDTGERILNVPRYTYDIGIQYNDKSLSGSLRGHYIWWNAEADFMGKYSAFIWDLNLIKKIYTTDKRTLEIFLTAHNIFNGSQYSLELFKNPRRWIEGGLRLKF